MKRFGIVIIIVFILNSPATIIAGEYTDSCARHAKKLSYAADEYDSAKLDLESAKSAFESACDPSYGYSKDDESACGTYGYERSSLVSAVSSLEDAASELEYAMDRVNRYCGTCQNSCSGIQATANLRIKKLKSQIAELVLKIKQLESKEKKSN